MIIRNPSPALVQRICAAGEMGSLLVTHLPDGRAEVSRGAYAAEDADGSALSEPEQRRVAGLVAADDAEPFAEVPRCEFGIWTPDGGKRRGSVVAANRNDAVDLVSRSWFSGIREHAEAAVRGSGPNHRARARGIYDAGGEPAPGVGGRCW